MDLFLPTLSGYRHPGDQDFNALPRFRQQGIGTRLMDEAERKVSERSGVAGIGVGLSPDYGAAQRLYALRGYAPDGKGLTSNVIPVRPGDEITVNDGLAFYLTKTPAEEPSPKLPSQGDVKAGDHTYRPSRLPSNVVEPCSPAEHPCG